MHYGVIYSFHRLKERIKNGKNSEWKNVEWKNTEWIQYLMNIEFFKKQKCFDKLYIISFLIINKKLVIFEYVKFSFISLFMKYNLLFHSNK